MEKLNLDPDKYYRLKTFNEMRREFGQGWKENPKLMWIDKYRGFLGRAVDQKDIKDHVSSPYIIHEGWLFPYEYFIEIPKEGYESIMRNQLSNTLPYVLSSSKDIYDIVGIREKRGNNTCSIAVRPTNNCQLSCFGNFEDFYSFYDSDFKNLKLHIKKIIGSTSGKPLLLIDIHQHNDKLIEALKDITLSSQNYYSTNESKMVIIILNINKI